MRFTDSLSPVRLSLLLIALVFIAGCDTLGSDDGDAPPAAEQTRLYPVLLDGRWGYIDDRGRMVITPQFAEARAFASGRAPVRTRTTFRWGYVDASGQLAIEDRYQETRTFRSERGAVRQDGRWGFVDASGDQLIGPRFIGIDSFSEGYAFVRRLDGSRTYVDRMGVPVERGDAAPDLQNTDWSDVSDGVAVIRAGDAFGFLVMDGSATSGSPLFAATFVDARPFDGGVAPVKVSDRWGLIDKTGTFVASPRWIAMGAFGEGLAPARVDGDAWGYVSTAGAVAIAPKWDEARPFREGRAAVRTGARWGFIDQTGREVVPPQFDEVRDYENGAAAVLRFVGDETLVGYVDGEGAYLWFPTN